jgi:putrescine aminotransferase
MAMDKSRAQIILEKDKKHLLHGAVPLDKFAERGSFILSEAHGMYVKDINGKEYLDATSGAVSVNVGYGREEMARVAMEQMLKHSYCPAYGGYASEASIELAHRLAGLTPPGLSRFFLTNGGGEAVDSAIKIARFYWTKKGKKDKFKIISRQNAYHGLNIGSMCATGIPVAWGSFGTLAPGFAHIPAPHCYRCPVGKNYPDCDTECARALADMIEKEGEDTVAAFIAEPVYGVGGCLPPPPEYCPEIRKICTDHNILFIADEVMTGFGRTGKMFAVEHWDVKPDLMTLSKGINSSALPLGAVAIDEAVFQAMHGPEPFFHLYTCGAHPVVCAVANKNLDILIDEGLVDNAATMGTYLLDRLKEVEDLPHVGEVRGLGLMTGVEIVSDKEKRTPFPPALGVADKLLVAARERGLLARGFFNAYMLTPPLIVTRDQIDEMVDITKSVLSEFKPE